MNDHTRPASSTAEINGANAATDRDAATDLGDRHNRSGHSDHGSARRNRGVRNPNQRVRNPNRRVRRSGSRLAVVAAFAAGAVMSLGGVASADNGGGGDAWSPHATPRVTVPVHKVPRLDDYVVGGSLSKELPEEPTWPDDDADPEPAHRVDPGADTHDADPGRFTVDADHPVSLDPEDLDRLLPGEDEGAGDPEPGEGEGGEPEPCEPPADETTDGPDTEPGECEHPGETSGTTVPEETTTTVDEEPRTKPEVEPEFDSGLATKELAFTGSGPALPLIGAGLLGTGVVVAGISMASRRRTTGQGEA